MSATEAIEQAPLSRFHKRLALYSAGGPFLDGYILSIVGVALVQATPALHLSLSWQGAIGAAALVGMFFGGFAGGWLADRFGRQTLYTLDLIAIIGCSIAQFWVQTPLSLAILRFFMGIAIAADYPIASSLLAEFTPARYRGPFIGGLVAMWYVGAASAYLIGAPLLHLGQNAWRWMLASAAFPAVIFVIMRHGTPESPRWLMQKGRIQEARAVVQRVYGQDAEIPRAAGSGPVELGLGSLFQFRYGGRLLFVTAFWTCSIVPMFAIYAFGPRILGALGLTGERANLGSALITILFLVGSVAALLFIDRLGRRQLVLQSFLWSGLALLLLGLFPNRSSSLTMLLFCAYALFIGGTQILQWIYPNELFPTEIRGTAVGFATSLSRVGAAVGTYLVPYALEKVGIGATILMAAGITLLGFTISLRAAPETRGLSLDECASL